jgi:hypothetical protein
MRLRRLLLLAFVLPLALPAAAHAGTTTSCSSAAAQR